MTGADDMEVSKPVTALDLAVISAVGSVYHAVKKQNQAQEVYVTTAEIWRLLNGYAINDATAKPHDKQLARIQKSIERQSVNRVSIDFTAEAERRQLEIDGERIKKGILKGNMLQTQADLICRSHSRQVTRQARARHTDDLQKGKYRYV